jgi:hypothetical protein
MSNERKKEEGIKYGKQKCAGEYLSERPYGYSPEER